MILKNEYTNERLNYLYIRGINIISEDESISDSRIYQLVASCKKLKYRNKKKYELLERNLRVTILKIESAMARIHFRYFKNKSYHRLHLENIACVLCNLMTGVELENCDEN